MYACMCVCVCKNENILIKKIIFKKCINLFIYGYFVPCNVSITI